MRRARGRDLERSGCEVTVDADNSEGQNTENTQTVEKVEFVGEMQVPDGNY